MWLAFFGVGCAWGVAAVAWRVRAGPWRRWRGAGGVFWAFLGGRSAFFGPFSALGRLFWLFCAFFGLLFCEGARRGVGDVFGAVFGRNNGGTGCIGAFLGPIFSIFWSRKRAPAPWATFLARENGFLARVQGGLGQGGGIVMHSTCLAGCQIFSSLARFYFLPAHALRCSLLLCAPHYYTHAQRSPAARLFALARLRLARSCTNQTTDKSQRIASKACSAAYNPAFAPKVVCNAVSRRHLLHPHSSQAAPRPFRRNALSTSANVSPGNPVSQTTNVTSQLLSSVDSGILEAFSHYPTRGSLSA